MNLVLLREKNAERERGNMKSISTGAINEDALYMSLQFSVFSVSFLHLPSSGKVIAPRRDWAVRIRQTEIDG